jgi:hypothetical protein
VRFGKEEGRSDDVEDKEGARSGCLIEDKPLFGKDDCLGDVGRFGKNDCLGDVGRSDDVEDKEDDRSGCRIDENNFLGENDRVFCIKSYATSFAAFFPSAITVLPTLFTADDNNFPNGPPPE